MREYIMNLQKEMAQVFNLNELETLVFELDVDWEELPGRAKSRKIHDFIITLAKVGRLSDLITTLRTKRLHVQWIDAPSPQQQINFSKGIHLEESTYFDALSLGVDIMGEIGDQVVDSAKGLQTAGTQHQRMVEARDGLIVNRSHGQMQSIKPEQFEEKLKTEDLEHINTLAKSLENLYRQWQEIYPKRNSYSRPEQNKRVQQKLDELAKEVAKDLGRIVRYLDKLDFELDDHYRNYRDVADEYA